MTKWPEVALGELITPARVPRAGDEDLPVLSMTMHDGLVDQFQKFKKRVASKDTSSYKIITSDQLVVGFPIDEGVLAVQDRYPHAIVSPAYDVWDMGDVDRAYLQRFLRSPRALAFYRSKLRSTTARRRTLPKELFLSLKVPLPSLPEQRRIANILDQADALRAKRRETLRLLDDVTQSIFRDMFGDVEARTPLAERVVEFRYGTSTKSAPDGVPTLRIPNVVGGGLDLEDMKFVPVTDKEFNRLRLRDGDVLFVRTNGNPENVGRCAYFDSSLISAAGLDPASCVYASYLIRARIEGIDPTFVTNYLATAPGRKQLRDRSKTSAGQYNINIQGLRSVLIPDVPQEQQCEFARRTEQVRNHRATVGLADAELDALFVSLQQRAFSGQL